MTDHEKARHRVLHSRRLRKYLAIIMGDGYAGADHFKWVATARVADIEEWADQIRKDSE